MNRRVLAVILTVTLLGSWVGAGFAQDYRFRPETERFNLRPPPEKPGPGKMALDASIGRPVGLAATAIGTTLFVLTLPFTAPSGSAPAAREGLVRTPARWTFKRPLGQRDPSAETPQVFRPQP
jgi:hypothetical protein